jgi:hypothetical protein
MTGPTSFALRSWHINGVFDIRYGWMQAKFYPDFRARLQALEARGWDKMGFGVSDIGGWQCFTRAGADYAIASGETFLLVAKSQGDIKLAIDRARAGNGFHFSAPAGFETQGAFYRDQIDLGDLKDKVGQAMSMYGSGTISPMMQEMVPMFADGLGLEALSKQHTAMFLRNGDIEAVRRIELTGDARQTPIGALVYSEPSELMTAKNGPFELIGEAAWANPGKLPQPLMDYVIEKLAPALNAQMVAGGGEAIDPRSIPGMIGLADTDLTNLASQVYVLATGSEDRGNGRYFPGLTVLVRTDNPELHSIVSGMVASLTEAESGVTLHRKDVGDTNAETWVLEDPNIPLSPTIAWTNGWVVESLWREDAMKARDALEKGTLLTPDPEGAANVRVRCNRRELLRGIADATYDSGMGGMAEIAAQLSGENERLWVEMVNHGDYTEGQCRFSLGLFEHMARVLAFEMKPMTQTL